MTKKIFFSLCFVAILLEVAPAEKDFKICRKRNGNVPKTGTFCRGYYTCKNFIPTEQICQEGEHFNTNNGRCDLEDIFPCLEIPKFKECPTENGYYLKPGTNCEVYYDCCNGKPTEKRCRQGTFFDPSKRKCEWSSLYTCIESISTTEKVLSTIVTMFTSSPSTDDQKEKTSEDTSLPTSSVQQTTTSIRNTYSTLDPGFEKTDTEEFISSSEFTSTESHSTVSSTSTYSTIYPDTEKTSSGDLVISTDVTSNEDHSTTSNEIIYSSLDPSSEKTNSEDIEVSTEMSSESTPTEIQWTSLATRESTSISPPTTSLPSSTHATDDPISKEDREFTITESTVYETTISSTYSTTTELSTTAEITDEVTSTQQVTTIETKLPEITSTIGETTTPDVESNFMCPEPNGYFPHPTDKHKFVGCTNNIPAVLTCPGNLIYKHKLRRCDYQ
ncbi:uncharacterized protein TNCT_464382 [Trichonephila clavata]|uniref:Chitin-binding type-2 domain-containing protein n=1 Tax=Trichonephila clavata TaxID=2740835 RepID=A0A8X6HKN3_TRICU|nr:uncharacterized protein TNCT_464382 [Trichonephila clavata]